MKKDKQIPKFNPEEVEGENAVQNTEVKNLISDTEEFFKEEDDVDDFNLEKCTDTIPSNSSFLSGVLTEYDVYYVMESDPDKILSKRVRATDKADARIVFYAETDADADITGIEEADDDSSEMIPDYWFDDNEADDDDGDDYSDETPAYFYDADLD